MKRTKVKLQLQSPSISMDGSAIMLSEAIAKKWKIPLRQSLQLQYGSYQQEVMVVPVSQTASVMRISEPLLSRWGLTHGDQLCLQYRPGTRQLLIGPLIGVLVSRVYTSNPDKPFGASTAFTRELTDACKLYGAAVFFCTPDDVQSQSETIRGWQYTNKWVRSTFPIPNVIYNRLTSRKLENQVNVQQFLGYAKSEHSAIFFNEKYLNKTEVFDALRKESGLQVYLPESYLLKSPQLLKMMCVKHPVVFLKPITGSLGKGIIRIRRNPEGTYTCHFTDLSGARRQSYPSLSTLFSAISGKIKSQNYQIQQGINLLTVGGRPVDFRALVQRDEAGAWKITSIVARIAGNDHFVSNLARGGTLSTVKEALSRAGTAAASGGYSKLQLAALRIAKGIETQVSGHFAELGIDLALDTQGRVWLIEVNSKPSKDDNTPLSAEERKIRPSVKRLVQYARFISKF
ncbi:YheC/YheD family endospore coat-associated protein [Paenibacillus cremeus]|uniref:YheC/YheD family protein n=1 Tax=Paenibacillus cremeus TaxID=2163881 RepID=A0A559K5I9_9BACL|nr:YheC/YheD family protein [Paenibacillus cremeus]TVY07415.1 YheC/YheD family protein [Paenibacillus cremeus]